MEQHRPAPPDRIVIRGSRVHNLKNIDLDIPLHQIVGIAGVSGSGKSSLALGILYAEGSRRYLESLSTYTRRRMTQAEKAQVDQVLYVPAARAPLLRGIPLDKACQMTRADLVVWVEGVLDTLPEPMRPMACSICVEYLGAIWCQYFMQPQLKTGLAPLTFHQSC